jgi:hypothetical protein
MPVSGSTPVSSGPPLVPIGKSAQSKRSRVADSRSMSSRQPTGPPASFG